MNSPLDLSNIQFDDEESSALAIDTNSIEFDASGVVFEGEQAPAHLSPNARMRQTVRGDIAADLAAAQAERSLSKFADPTEQALDAVANPIERPQTAASSVGRGVADTFVEIPAAVALGKGQQAKDMLDLLDEYDATGSDAVFGRPLQESAQKPFDAATASAYVKADQDGREEIRKELRRQYFGAAETPMYKLTKSLREAVESGLPVNPEYEKEILAGKLPHAVGQGIGFMAQILATRRVLPPAVAAGASGAMMSGVQGFEDAIAKGASIEDAYRSSRLNQIGGMTEGLPHELDPAFAADPLPPDKP